MAVEAQRHDWLPPIFEIKSSSGGMPVDIDFRAEGSGVGIEITQEGHGGWGCCSSHSSHFTLDAVQCRELIAFLGGALQEGEE